MKPNPTVAYVSLCLVLCVGLGVGAYLTTHGHDSAAFWTSLAALVGILVSALRTEKIGEQLGEQVQTIREQTNGANSSLRRAALTALAQLPPDQANEVLRTMGVTRDTPTPMDPPSGRPPDGRTEPGG